MLDRVRPDVVVGYGGYVSMPAYLAARRAKVPIVVHEQNALPGLANRAGARIARRVAVSFPDTPLPHAEYVGLPIRTMISGLDRAALRAEARAFFGLDADRPTLVVTGGSQGARNVNNAVAGAARALGEAGRAGAARRRPQERRGAPGRRADLRAGRLRRPDGLRPRGRRPDGLPGRRLERDRGGRGRPAGDLRARCPIGNGEQVLQRPAGSPTPGERCWWPTATSPRRG